MFDSWNWEGWYQSLEKPAWTPTGETIGLIWGILYPIIFISFGWVFYKVYTGKIPKSVAAPFLLNLAANLSFTPILFGVKNIPLATLDILIVLGTIVWSIRAVYKYSPIVAWAQVPYLSWVILATILQLSILVLNF